MRWRLDSRYRFTLTNRRVRRNPFDYVRDNFSVTTSGQFSDVPLHAALAAMGPRRVMFSVDYPYESSAVAGRFMDTATIPENTRTLVGHENAKAPLNGRLKPVVVFVHVLNVDGYMISAELPSHMGFREFACCEFNWHRPIFGAA
jgi:hypothetical protein